MKTILIYGDHPISPANEGNRKRILDLFRFLNALGFETHYLFHGSAARAKIQIEHLPEFTHRIHWHRQTTTHRITRTLTRAKAALGKILNIPSWREYSSNAWFPSGLELAVTQKARELKPVAVISEYAYLSMALHFLPDGPLKIVDTHDIFAERWQLFEQQGSSTTWYSISRSSEAELLRAADAVIAISENDQSAFKSQYEVASHLLDLLTAPDYCWSPESTQLMFLGSNNRMNREGLHWLLENVVPLIRNEIHDFVVTVVGSVTFDKKYVNYVNHVGRVDFTKEHFKKTKVLLNPVDVGTGFAIKIIDSLAYGIPVITRSNGVRGASAFVGRGIFVADSPTGFCKAVLMYIQDTTIAKLHSEYARTLYEERHHRCKEVALEILGKPQND